MDAKIGQKLTDQEAMRLAIQQAYLSAAFVSPNPLVGAVVLSPSNELISFGRHEIYGGPHAEVNALKDVPLNLVKDSRVFVTLEPCAHEGKTPSCAKMLANLPIAEVVFGLIDPNPLVAGQGAQILKDAGIKTICYSEEYAGTDKDLSVELNEVCEVFLYNFRFKKPFVALKVAQSLDGQVALSNGESKWITSEQAREHGHYLRAIYDATLVGVGTVLADDPSLNVRLKDFQKINSVVVLDSNAKLISKLGSLNLNKAHAAKNFFWVIKKAVLNAEQLAMAKKHVTVIELQPTETRIDLDECLAALWNFGLRSILVEGGPTVTSSFLKNKKLQKLFVFTAPKILGAGKSWSEQLQVSKIIEAVELENVKTQALGPDILVVGSVKQ